MNTRSGKIMKPNYRPNGYEYYCLCANSKLGQKKYNTHRLVMKAFEPREDMDELEVNHIYGDKTKNYLNKVLDDGSIDSSIEWTTAKENIHHARKNGYIKKGKLSDEDADEIRKMHNLGYSYEQIVKTKYSNVSTSTIADVCKNKTHHDPNYIPNNSNYVEYNPANIHKLTDKDVDNIRNLYNNGYSNKEIKNNFYPNFSLSTILDTVTMKSHNK